MGPTLLEDKINLDASWLGIIVGVTVLILLLVGSLSVPRKMKMVISLVIAGVSVVTMIGLDHSLPLIRYEAALSAAQENGGKIVDVEDGLKVDFSGSELSEEQLDDLFEEMIYLTNLVELDLENTKVTDDSLKPIGEMETLRRINLKNCDVTSSGVRKLKRSLRKLEVIQ